MIPQAAKTHARREWLVVAVVTLVAAILRLWGFGRVGLTHFDEGVYALTGLWSISPGSLSGLDPGVVAYAPPGYPILVGLAYSVLGVSDVAPLLVSVGCGVMTVPLVAWVGRRTFGPGAGAASAVLVALSPAHIAFSRKALTDAPFLLVWVLALGVGGWFLERPRLGRAVALGVAVGVCQNVKYNGGIAGVIVILAASLGVIGHGEERTRSALLHAFGYGLFAALLAASLYWPWYRFVEGHGGYSALLGHQRSYLGDSSAWLPHWRQQLAQVVALSGGRGWGVTVGLAAWSAAVYAGKAESPRPALARSGLLAYLLVVLVAFGTVLDLGWWAGTACFPWLATDPRPARRMLASSWLILSAMTPFYHPYARLWLPLHAVGWLMLAGVVVGLGRLAEEGNWKGAWATLARPRFRVPVLVTVTMILVSGFQRSGPSPTPFALAELFRDTASLRNVASEAAHGFDPDPRAGQRRIRLHARRPLAFYLATRGIPFVLADGRAGIGTSARSPADVALLDDTLDQGMPEGSASFESSWKAARSWDVFLDPVTRLDVAPASAYDPGIKRFSKIETFVPRPP